MVRRPRREDADTLRGVVCFGDQDSQGVYVIKRAHDPYPPRALEPGAQWVFPPWVQAPLPPRFEVPLNIPLRLVVARAVTAALDDNWPYEQWQTVTSVVEREQVSQVLAQDIGLTYGFRLQGLPADLRQALCEVQGL